MANLAIDNQLIEQAQRIGHHKSKEDAVISALEEYVKLEKRRDILNEQGQIEFWPEFDHKLLRRDRTHG